MTEAKSAQPQLPPRPKYMRPRNFDPADFVFGYEETTKYMNALEAENESLKARLMQVDDVLVVNWITVEDGDYREALHKLIKYNIAIHDDPAVSEVAANRKAECDQALGVVREYRDFHHCAEFVNLENGRCPTCIKADELLSGEPKKGRVDA